MITPISFKEKKTQKGVEEALVIQIKLASFHWKQKQRKEMLEILGYKPEGSESKWEDSEVCKQNKNKK